MKELSLSKRCLVGKGDKMDKRRVSLVVIVLLLFINIFSFQNVLAEDRLMQVDINVFINDDGSARIKEERNVVLNEGTENFLVIGNLEDSTIEDFTVQENDEIYQYVDDWDTDDSREYKKYKNGIIDKGDSYELVWGIGKYGEHDYILEYTVTNFVKELEDAQVVFWRFINDQTNIPPESVNVIIETDEPINLEKEKVWSFGYEGEVGTQEGKIIARNSEPLDEDNYLTVLLKFPKGRFSTGAFVDRTFEEVKDEAFKGSDYGSDGESAGSFMNSIGSFLIRFLIPIVIVFNFFRRSQKGSRRQKKFKRKYKQEYYRDYPYDGDILDIHHILYEMGVGNFENLLTSFILKWIKEGRIEIETQEVGFIRKRNESTIRFLDESVEGDLIGKMDSSGLEGELFYMIFSAAGSNKILEEKEFTKWASNNRGRIEEWKSDVEKESASKLQDLGYLKVEEKRKFFIKTYDIVLTQKGEELEEKIYKYINYLHDFSLLNENEAINVKIWDDIMVWAGALGLTEVVRKQFENLYPRYDTETVYTGNSIYFTHMLTRNVARAATPTSTRSSGMGGSSSIGGGGGSFGGGSGGGTR